MNGSDSRRRICVNESVSCLLYLVDLILDSNLMPRFASRGISAVNAVLFSFQ